MADGTERPHSEALGVHVVSMWSQWSELGNEQLPLKIQHIMNSC